MAAVETNKTRVPTRIIWRIKPSDNRVHCIKARFNADEPGYEADYDDWIARYIDFESIDLSWARTIRTSTGTYVIVTSDAWIGRGACPQWPLNKTASDLISHAQVTYTYRDGQKLVKTRDTIYGPVLIYRIDPSIMSKATADFRPNGILDMHTDAALFSWHEFNKAYSTSTYG